MKPYVVAKWVAILLGGESSTVLTETWLGICQSVQEDPIIVP